MKASRKPANAARVTRRADGVGQPMFGSNGTVVHAEHPSSRSLWSILPLLKPRREWTADSFCAPSPCRLLLARMLSWCPALGTKKRHPGVDTTVDPHYSRYVPNTNRINPRAVRNLLVDYRQRLMLALLAGNQPMSIAHLKARIAKLERS